MYASEKLVNLQVYNRKVFKIIWCLLKMFFSKKLCQFVNLFNITCGLWFIVLFSHVACVTYPSPNPSPSGTYRYEEMTSPKTSSKSSPTEETILPPPPFFDVRIVQSWQRIIICLKTTTLYTLTLVINVSGNNFPLLRGILEYSLTDK